ncbi:cop9 signalosome complex subunit 1-like protein [Trifolium pratense]|uniref:Cop9 signalosome complex subunit 1-like protein n=1 Tax=Trifolium pratense TaxID=57577 RepID=A0A2K3P0Y5_TRIPR|nr:cop9 signalosome complex subunit 1-like protein [Trifolium pratense]
MDTDEDTSALNVDEIYANGADDDNSTHRQIISADQLDIEAYINLYSGRTRISRLLFIASNCGDNLTMQLEALRMAFDEIKKGEDTILMREVVKKINGRLGSNYTLDEAWCDAIVKKADLKKEKLDAELTSYRTNLIKESIRMGYSDFGDFYYAHGQLGDAFKNYVRTRDYCTTSKHIVYMCMSAILVSIEMGQFPHISSYVSKAEQSVESLDTIATAKLRCAAGLSNLFAKKYKLAARKFIETSPELGSHYNEVISSQDVAMYGGLCALATFDRAELKACIPSKVIDNTVFRNFLDRYALCLEYLGNLKSNLLLDIHLHSHVEALYDQIRQKALIQYTLPFVSVDLNMMANAFKTTVAGLQKELETLITDNQIQARIDSHSKVLYARHADLRNATFQRVLETGRAFDRDLQSMFLRSSIIKHESLHRSRSRKL